MPVTNQTEWRFDYSFRVRISEQEQSAIVAFCGDFDALTVAAFRRAVTIPIACADVVLDLSELNYADMTGVREVQRLETPTPRRGHSGLDTWSKRRDCRPPRPTGYLQHGYARLVAKEGLADSGVNAP